VTWRLRAVRVSLLVAATLALAVVQTPRSSAAAASPTAQTATAPPGRLIRVPEDVPTPQAAIDAAQPGDVILLAAGTYAGGLIVPPTKPDLTIRGVDRAGVVFDGKGAELNAIEIQADRVTLENLSGHDFDANAFYWEKVDGFTGRYLTVWNVSLYGIYATESRGGLFEQSLVSGAADAAFYVGECQPCDTTIRNVEGRLSAIGYSGTNTGGGLELLDSTWDRNGTGILPNSYDGQALPPPETDSRIEGNTVRGSGTVPVPANTPLAGFIGMGIGVAGGNANTIVGNTVTGSAAYGIALYPTIQLDLSSHAPQDNQVRGNTLSGSAKADLALARGVAGGNCFAGNTFVTSLPAKIEELLPCEGQAGSTDGDASVAADLAVSVPDALDRLALDGPRPDWRSMPAPESQPNSPDQLPAGLRSFRPDDRGPIVLASVVVVLGVIGIILLVRRRRRSAGHTV
jgi:parallel beta-helix repeat protein